MNGIRLGAMVVNEADNKKFYLYLNIPETEHVKISSDAEAIKIMTEVANNRGPLWESGKIGSVIDVSGEWVKVLTPSGPGWVHNKKISVL